MELKYFGTDGIRGRAFESPLSVEEVCKWGCAWASVAKDKGIQTLIIGWDGRTSCTALLHAFLAGFGNDIKTVLLGIVPTPTVAWSVSRQPNAWGLVLSASHNPPEDNGLKGFDSKGAKLDEDVEHAIESAFMALTDKHAGTMLHGNKSHNLHIQHEATEDYLSHLGTICIPDDFPVVMDCAHGSAAPWADRLFTGAIQWLGTPNDGERINVRVGSTHLEDLRQRLLDTKAAAGVAFDGDGDRCLFLDGEGEIVDGDQMLWLLTQDRCRRGSRPSGVIGTLMSNCGLEQGLRQLEIPFVRTPVGDKFMLRELDRTGWDLAAEASGHVIQRHLGPSGDGLATALSVLRILIQKPLTHRWDWRFAPWPLKLVNIRAQHRVELSQCAALQKAIEDAKNEYGDSLRLVIRWSGTEPLLRLMAEAKEQWQVENVLNSLTTAANSDLLI